VIVITIKAAHLVLDQLQVPQLVDEQSLVRRMEKGSGQHPLEALGDVVIVHQQAGEQQANSSAMYPNHIARLRFLII
jgi:hypothetical protein